MSKAFRLSLNEAILKYGLNMTENDIADKVKQVFDPPPLPETIYSRYFDSLEKILQEEKKFETFVEKILRLDPSPDTGRKAWVDAILQLDEYNRRRHSKYRAWIEKHTKIMESSKFHSNEFILKVKGLL